MKKQFPGKKKKISSVTTKESLAFWVTFSKPRVETLFHSRFYFILFTFLKNGEAKFKTCREVLLNVKT